jgi:hypothetical protein
MTSNQTQDPTFDGKYNRSRCQKIAALDFRMQSDRVADEILKKVKSRLKATTKC